MVAEPFYTLANTSPLSGTNRRINFIQVEDLAKLGAESFALTGPSASPTTSSSPLWLEGLTGTFGFTTDVALATLAIGTRRDLRLHHRCRPRHFSSRGSPGPSASPWTSPLPLRLKGLARTFGFTSNIALAATSA
jgi:hypothetical protein